MSINLYQNASISHHHNVNKSIDDVYPENVKETFSLQATQNASEEIKSWSGYQQTELHSLPTLAKEFGLENIYYKDESSRFGLGSFKALGGAYAVLYLLQKEIADRTGQHVTGKELEQGAFKEIVSTITVATATDGNHGRSVAWGATRFGCQCRIYIHASVSENRKIAMEELGATVIRIDGNYDESVHLAASEANENNWFIVSDTSYPGYLELPKRVMAGYSVMLEEISAQLSSEKSLTHVFVQGGVGGLAGSVCAYLWEKLGNVRPRFIVVEPDLADCLYQSSVNNQPTEVDLVEETIMAGLSCGEVSQLAWDVLSLGTDDFLTISDESVAPLMRLLAAQTPSIEAGESAVAGLAGCLIASQSSEIANAMGLDSNSRVLVLGTEGATDRDIYDAILADG